MSKPQSTLPVEVYTEYTFSSQTLKFVTNMMLIKKGGVDFSNKKEAQASPLAEKLFQFDAVINVFIYRNFISVTKTEQAEWYFLKARLRQAIKNYLQANAPIVKEDYKKAALRQVEPQQDDSKTVQQIKKVLAEEIHPSTQTDGGGINFKTFEDGVVYIDFEGAYCNCPSSKATVRSSVETLLKEKVEEVEEVQLHKTKFM